MKITKINRILKILNDAALPYRVGFIPGHYYLTERQMGRIADILHMEDGGGIVSLFEKKFAGAIGSGAARSFAAGRMAFFALLKAINIGKGDEVILPSFTCSVMPNAVFRSGANPVFANIDINTFGSNAGAIEARITKRTKLIVAQHTFGIPCDIREIVDLGRKHRILIVEDCAIAFDSSIDGVKVGDWGDAAFFSTDHSKPLNTIIGGIFYTKDKTLFAKIDKLAKEAPGLSPQRQMRLYDRFNFEKRYNAPHRHPRLPFYNLMNHVIKSGCMKSRGKGQAFLEADYRRDASVNPPYPYPARMPSFLAQLGLFELERWPEERRRRKDMLQKYMSIANELGLSGLLPTRYFDKRCDIAPLRFIFCHPERDRLFKKMRFIDIDGIWFQDPVICCPDGPESMGYVEGSCSASEKICGSVVNWPCVIPHEWESRVLRSFRECFI